MMFLDGPRRRKNAHVRAMPSPRHGAHVRAHEAARTEPRRNCGGRAQGVGAPGAFAGAPTSAAHGREQ
eukprot:62881-Pyramimonas_sp.AAC.1